jgi:hypothetical protein
VVERPSLTIVFPICRSPARANFSSSLLVFIVSDVVRERTVEGFDRRCALFKLSLTILSSYEHNSPQQWGVGGVK